MNIAHERVAQLCAQLKLTTIADALPHLAQKAIADDVVAPAIQDTRTPLG